MKKIFGLMAAAALVVGGSFGFAAAAPGGACEGNIDADCTIGEGDDQEHCDLYVSVPEGELFVCEDGLV
ncbi:MAG TPA: hypothetical protein VGB64_13690 [Actinomycetota bacterium]